MKLRSSRYFEIGVTRVVSQPLKNFDFILPSGIRMKRIKENLRKGVFRLLTDAPKCYHWDGKGWAVSTFDPM